MLKGRDEPPDRVFGTKETPLPSSTGHCSTSLLVRVVSLNSQKEATQKGGTLLAEVAVFKPASLEGWRTEERNVI